MSVCARSCSRWLHTAAMYVCLFWIRHWNLFLKFVRKLLSDGSFFSFFLFILCFFFSSNFSFVLRFTFSSVAIMFYKLSSNCWGRCYRMSCLLFNNHFPFSFVMSSIHFESFFFHLLFLIPFLVSESSSCPVYIYIDILSCCANVTGCSRKTERESKKKLTTQSISFPHHLNHKGALRPRW